MDVIIENIVSFLINLGWALAFLLCSMELAKKQKNVKLILFILMVGLLQIRAGAYSSESIAYAKWVYALFFISVIMVLGPLLLQLVYAMVAGHGGRALSRLHYVPALIALILEVTIMFAPSEYHEYTKMRATSLERFTKYDLGLIIPVLHLLGYCTFAFVFVVHTIKNYQLQLSRLLIVIATSTAISPFMLAGGYWFKSITLFNVGGVFVCLSLIQAFIFSARYPDFFLSLRNEIKEKQYKKAIAEGKELELILARIGELMTNVKIYLNDDLRLHHVAEKLHVSPKYLSQLLNEHYKKNFNEFINDYRIEEAKRQLVEDINKPIIHVAYDSGFNAKSTFNLRFHKAIGVSPAQYRKSHKG